MTLPFGSGIIYRLKHNNFAQILVSLSVHVGQIFEPFLTFLDFLHVLYSGEISSKQISIRSPATSLVVSERFELFTSLPHSTVNSLRIIND